MSATVISSDSPIFTCQSPACYIDAESIDTTFEYESGYASSCDTNDPISISSGADGTDGTDGADGRSVYSIDWTSNDGGQPQSTEGTTDTYTITYTTDPISSTYPAAQVTANTANFTGNLSAADDTVQKALDTIDDLTLGSNVFDTGLTVDSGQTFLQTNGIKFGDGDTGFYENADDELYITISGNWRLKYETYNWQFRSDARGSGSSAPKVNFAGVTTATTPVFNPFLTDVDSGIGANGLDQVSIIAGGKEIARASENVTEQFIINPQGDLTGTTTAPSLAFGDGNSGWYEISDNRIGFVLDGGIKIDYQTSLVSPYVDISRAVANYYRLVVEESTATNPVYTFHGYEGYGLGGVPSSGYLSLIANSTEAMRLTETQVSQIAPNSASTPHANGSFSVDIDESGNNLTFRVKYSDGTSKSGTVALT